MDDIEPPSKHNQFEPRVSADANPRLSRSLEYGVAILESFTADRPRLGVSDMAAIMGISRSTIHRYAITLVRLGFLEQDGGRKYRLSRGAMLMGSNVIHTVRLETSARVILEALREKTRATVSLGVLDRTNVVYIERLFSHGTGQYEADLGLGVGAHVPVYCTAIGKVLLSTLGQDDQLMILEGLSLTQYGPNTITNKQELFADLLQTRLLGISTCDEEQAQGVRSIAVAVPDPGGSRSMAISVTIPAHLQTVEALSSTFGSTLKMAAAQIFAQLKKQVTEV